MKNNTSLIYSAFLVIGDFLALVGAFSFAYIIRVSINHSRIPTPIRAINYLETFLTLLPFFILLFGLIGLYSNNIYEQRFKEFGRLVIGCFVGTLFITSYGFITNTPIFPARIVILYGFLLALFMVIIFRTIARYGRSLLFRFNKGINNVLIVGDTRISRELIELLTPPSISGYRVVGVVGGIKHPLKSAAYACFDDFDAAINRLNGSLHTIIQTELYSSSAKNSQLLNYAQQHHVSYRFVPGNNELFVGNLDVEIFRGIPVIDVHQTALVGWGKIVKRTTDIVIGSLALAICSPFMLVIALAELLTHNGVLFKQTRLTRYDQHFTLYKFRTHQRRLDGTTPEEAFAMLGKPELARTYRNNGDFLSNDPRITRLGKFLRATSLDELPQLFNVIKGDLSLVGPRALIPEELDSYTHKHAILSVRSGITGLAQVSGRRDISFDQRRQLDLYYVQNWSFWNDLVILIRTFWVGIRHKGAV